MLPFWADDDHTRLDCAARLYTQEVWNGYTKETVEKVELFRKDGIHAKHPTRKTGWVHVDTRANKSRWSM